MAAIKQVSIRKVAAANFNEPHYSDRRPRAGAIEMDAMTNLSENCASESNLRPGKDPKCLPRRPDKTQVQAIVAQHKILVRERLAKVLTMRRRG